MGGSEILGIDRSGQEKPSQPTAYSPRTRRTTELEFRIAGPTRTEPGSGRTIGLKWRKRTAGTRRTESGQLQETQRPNHLQKGPERPAALGQIHRPVPVEGNRLAQTRPVQQHYSSEVRTSEGGNQSGEVNDEWHRSQSESTGRSDDAKLDV